MTLAELVAWTMAGSVLVTDGNGTGPIHQMRRISFDGAVAIAEGCLADPLFQNDDGRKCASLLLEMGGKESNYTPTAIGDNHHAFGAFQSHYPEPYTREEILHWVPAVTIAIRQLRVSMQKCPQHVLAPYARGWCGSIEGQAISDERMAEAKRIYEAVPFEVTP